MHDDHNLLDLIFKGLTAVVTMGGVWLVNTTSKNKNKLDVMDERIKGEIKGRKEAVASLEKNTDTKFQNIKDSLERIESYFKKD